LVGDPSWKTSGVVVAIDLTDEAIELAIKRGARLIVNHHPCIFPRGRGPSRVTADAGGAAALVHRAIRAGIAVAAFHTNFDRCALEVAHAISKGLGCVAQGRLHDATAAGPGPLVKLVVFVPSSHHEAVRDALFSAGAGQVGLYDSCAFSVSGEGSFRGLEGTQPYIGQAGTRERADEVRLETVFPRGMEKPILQALRRIHPYEEIAYDLYPVEQPPSAVGLVSGLGYGFWGEYSKPKSFTEVMQNVKGLFRVDGFLASEVPVSARRSGKVRRIGFVAGKGSSFVGAAARAGCDIFITGEAGYHTALEGSRKGMVVVELGHRESERFFLSTISDWLKPLSVTKFDRPTQKFYGANK